MRVLRTQYVDEWETRKQDEIARLTARGEVPHYWELEEMKKGGQEPSPEVMIASDRLIMGECTGAVWSRLLWTEQLILFLFTGQAAGNIEDVLPAAQIVKNMITQCVEQVKKMSGSLSKLWIRYNYSFALVFFDGKRRKKDSLVDQQPRTLIRGIRRYSWLRTLEAVDRSSHFSFLWTCRA